MVLLAWATLPAIPAAATSVPPFALSAGAVLGGDPVSLPPEWRFSRAPSPAPGEPAAAPTANPALPPGSLPAGWSDRGWFALDLELPRELVGVPLALVGQTTAAVVIRIDGEPVVTWGAFTDDGAAHEQVINPPPAFFRPTRTGPHLLEVQVANAAAARFHRAGWIAGVSLAVTRADSAVTTVASRRRDAAGLLFGFAGVFATFGLLHLLLFAFRPEEREHLHFAVLCLVAGSLVTLLLFKPLLTSPWPVLWGERAINLTGLAFGLAALRVIYALFRSQPVGESADTPAQRATRRWWWFAAAALPIAALAIDAPRTAEPWVFAHMLAACIELIREVALAILARRPGARVLGVGLLLLGLGFTVGLLGNLGVIAGSRTTGVILPFGAMVALIISMSISLSQRFAATQRALRQQLAEVERLSAAALAQERRVQREEAERRLLEAEIRRKDDELEAARQLQLAMLPGALPAPAGYRLAARMLTASEVGGDTYDALLAADGELTLAVGDATGHGAQAGVMVTAFKSLFGALGGERDLVAALTTANRALKRIGWRRLAMAATTARLEGSWLRVAAAGMPPALVWRCATSTVEVIEVGGVPLGAMARPRYAETGTELAPGDLVLLASDGLFERRDAAGEELGVAAGAALFARAIRRAGFDDGLRSRPHGAAEMPGALVVAGGGAGTTVPGEEALLDALVDETLTFGNHQPLEDDLTLVLLHRLPATAAAAA